MIEDLMVLEQCRQENPDPWAKDGEMQCEGCMRHYVRSREIKDTFLDPVRQRDPNDQIMSRSYGDEKGQLLLRQLQESKQSSFCCFHYFHNTSSPRYPLPFNACLQTSAASGNQVQPSS
jgi:hypothetical protein